jgi:hypothetical protein
MLKLTISLTLALALYSFGATVQHTPTRFFPIDVEGSYGYMNTAAKLSIPAHFSAAGVFTNGLALVRTAGENGHWGYIDTSGNFVIKPVYMDATDFSEGLAFVSSVVGEFQAINKRGEEMFTFKASDIFNFYDGLAAFSVDNGKEKKYGFINKEGKVQIPPQFYYVSFFSGGYCAVMNKENKWAYIDSTGKMVTDYLFKDATPFNNHMAVVEEQACGVINEQGKYIVPPVYMGLILDGDKLVFKKDGLCGWMDINGKVIIAPQFQAALPFGNCKYAPAMSKEEWGYIDTKGNFVVQPQFRRAYKWDGDEAVAEAGNPVLVHAHTMIQGTFFYSRIAPDYQTDIVIGIYDNQYYNAIPDQQAKQVAQTFLAAFYNGDSKTCKTFLRLEGKKQLDIIYAAFPAPERKHADIFIDKIDMRNKGAGVYYRTSFSPEQHFLLMDKGDDSWKIASSLLEL